MVATRPRLAATPGHDTAHDLPLSQGQGANAPRPLDELSETEFHLRRSYALLATLRANLNRGE